MRETQWIEWTRTTLQHQEREELLRTLSSQQKARLREDDYVWVEGVGVLWNPPDGGLLRRARFTHGTRFQTARGTFYIDSEGNAAAEREVDEDVELRPLDGRPEAGALQQVLQHRDSAGA